MSDTAPLLIAHAGSTNLEARELLRTLPLPQLGALLAALTPGPIEHLPDEAFDTPDERALAQAMGLAVADGRIPWAALQATRSGLAPRGAAWGWLTPCHFDVGMNDVRLSDAEGLALPPAQAQALTASMAPYFAEDGIVLHGLDEGRWLAQGEAFRDLATASPARVAGIDLNPWMPASPLLRRLLNEMQMLLYTHPVNTEREGQGLPPVNALWLSGCGALPATAPRDAARPMLVQDLAPSALREDWQAWAAAWQQVDAQHCAPLLARLRAGQPVVLTLCGARSLQTWRSAPRSTLARLGGLWRKPRLHDLLGAL
ncbi:hypothetical protein [Pseudorhodoferax sp. Leaf267]|uniref:hypothetical protein n=1 Tax=Pseudorhodoferax sp. Leaf267 TaxID=1736316 RepID=UPI0006F9D0ED|nr:hypothetical protein [Pseudorhodoferax sp. Leaf267]KQP17680.1 hypothetical protein ASF43_07275 [Pseudorhodoferax sp. Leaf267]